MIDLKYGTSTKCEFLKKGVPVLRIPNIAKGIIDITDLKYGKLDKKEIESLKLQPGDILIIRSNGSVSLVGRSAIVDAGVEGFAYAGYLIRLRFDLNKVLPKYANLWLSSHYIREVIELEARSTSGVNNINAQEISDLPFRLIPVDEQEKVVHRVEALFGLADRLEAQYIKAKAKVDKLTQSVLAKAFRGELVPQDPSDEPASKLLERIKAEREAKLDPPKKAKGKPSKVKA